MSLSILCSNEEEKLHPTEIKTDSSKAGSSGGDRARLTYRRRYPQIMISSSFCTHLYSINEYS